MYCASFRHRVIVCRKCWVCYLTPVYSLLGCCKEVLTRTPLVIYLIHTGMLSSPCGHVIETRDWCTTGCFSDGHMWRHRDDGSTLGSHTCAIVFRLLVPYLEAFSGYMKSAPGLCTCASGSTAFTPIDLSCRPTPLAAVTKSPSAVRLVLMPSKWRIHMCRSVLLMHRSCFHLGNEWLSD